MSVFDPKSRYVKFAKSTQATDRRGRKLELTPAGERNIVGLRRIGANVLGNQGGEDVVRSAGGSARRATTPTWPTASTTWGG